ncbi:MAG: right-handed parallel beta-helix repeat-containing protein, partial [Oscillospiraceae bacterium]|nr:right-handed parallel beta-helix repeat-containing protein [Oscillospiraceae bacterium]
LAVIVAMASIACSVGMTAAQALTDNAVSGVVAMASESSVKFTNQGGFGEGVYAEWSAVSNATSYIVYVDGTKIDSMLIRQYPDCFRADAVGLKAGSHTIKVVPVINGKEDDSKSAETKATATAHDRSGFGFVNGTSSGAYNEDGTLKSDATVIYVTEENKDTIVVTLPDKNGKDAELVGVQNIITGLKSNKKVGPVVIRFIGNITDPEGMPKGDLYVDGVTCGLTLEGIGKDTTINGFGIVLKGCSNVEIRNFAFMNCNSSEGDNCGLQQDNDHIWVHNCDFYYGDAGSDADQVKGDGALDTKKSTYVTHSYNHFVDNGKCNLQGMKSETTENCVTYHHNWYDHSDSRHPRIRTCTVHSYNNYFDGNAKYGAGVTLGASLFVENNYFRNCKYPMLISMQGSDIANGTGTFSGENGGIIKSYGNYITGEKAYIKYQDDPVEFDAYEASSRDEKVPDSVTCKQGGTSYNNFDTASDMYSYTPDKAEDVPAIVMANAGRVQQGDIHWQFDNAVDDESYDVNQALKDLLVKYNDRIIAIGSGFTDSTDPSATEATTPQPTDPQPTESKPVETDATEAPKPTDPTPTDSNPTVKPSYSSVIYAAPDGKGSGKTTDDPAGVLDAIQNVPAGGVIYLLEGTYKFDSTILIDQNNSGTKDAYKTICAYNNAKVVFDFSAMTVDNANRGIVLDGSYWYFYGFEITKAGDNGMLLSGNNNIIEMMQFTSNQDTGLQISRYRTDAAAIADWPTNNLIKNCTAKNNCDDATMENADGFAAKLTCGEGNVFDGCMSYNNSDDGWDLYAKTETGPIGVVTLKNCIAFRNGFTEDGRGYGDCDGNGFKLGGGGVGTAHVVENCLAFENLNCGFTDNNNPLLGGLKDCTAYNNGIGGNGKPNFSVYRCTDTTTKFDNLMAYINTDKVSKTDAAGIKLSSDKFVGEMTNSLYYNSKKYYFISSTTKVANGDKTGDVVTPADSDFINLTVPAMGTDFHTEWRNADGSPKPAGFAETVSNGTYATLGYHMASGLTQETTPGIGDGKQDPVEPPETDSTDPDPTTSESTSTGNIRKGDANEDGNIDISDVVLMNRVYVGVDKVTPQGLKNADIDGSGKIELSDSMNVLRYLVHLVEEL